MRRLATALLVLALALTACTDDDNDGPPGALTYDSNPSVLNIVAGSEQEAVFTQIVTPWCQRTKLTCNLTKLGSVDQARLLQSGEAPYDAFWFASSVFEQIGNTSHKLRDVAPMFSTPVVFAGWRSEMDKLGFVGREVSIQDVLAAVESNKTKVWVTNPTQSNSGATVLLGFLNHFAGNQVGEPLTQQQLDSAPVKDGITRFARAFDKTPPSTGTLMDDCVADPNECRTMFTYESLVMERNAELVKAGKEPLYAVYPTGSLAISDAPLGFFPHGDNAEKAANFKKLQSYLLSTEAQNKLVELGRRPIASIGLSLPNPPREVFNTAWGIRPTINGQPITYPTAPVIEAALSNYHGLYRTPADLVYCIDGSGSMDGNGGWDGVKQAADLLFDPVQSKKYLLQANPADKTTALVFASEVKGGPWTVRGADLTQIGVDVKNQSPGGGTGIYRCLGRAAEQFQGPPTPDRKRLVILMTDGANTDGGPEGLDAIARAGVPVVAVGFGDEIDENTMRSIAARTRGTYLKSNDMVSALREATGYR